MLVARPRPQSALVKTLRTLRDISCEGLTRISLNHTLFLKQAILFQASGVCSAGDLPRLVLNAGQLKF